MAYMRYGDFEFSPSSGYPTPQMNISVEQNRNGDGTPIGSTSTISLEGVICTSGSKAGFQDLLNKEARLRSAFNCDGAVFVVSCSGGTGSSVTPFISGLPKITRYSAEKTDNNWTTTIAYNIELQVANTGSGCKYPVTSTQNEWNIENIDEFSYVNNPVGANALRQALNMPHNTGYPIYRVSRTLGAVGLFTPSGVSCPSPCSSGATGTIAVDHAKAWVLNNMNGPLSVSNVIVGLELFNFSRSININQGEGSYRITDNFIGVPSGLLNGYTESFSAESSLDNTYLRTVTINGTVKGLEPINVSGLYTSGTLGGSGVAGSLSPFVGSGRYPNTSKFDKALSGYYSGVKNNIFNRAQSFIARTGEASGIFRRFFSREENQLNPIPVSVVEGFNPMEGSVTYSYVYNNRPLNLISGSISETLTVNDTFPTQQVAEIFVLGRRLGPILQNLGTYTTASREVTFEVVMLRPTGLSGIKFPKTAYSAITGVIELFNPTYALSTSTLQSSDCKSFVKNNTETWNVSEGRFVKNKSWAWAKCSDIVNANISVEG